MCWWKKPKPPVVYPYSSKVLLTFAVNDYMGSDNDLNGCVPDSHAAVAKFPDFQARQYLDDKATPKAFLDAIAQVKAQAVAGDVLIIHYSGHGTQVRDPHGDEVDGYEEALYMYGGMVTDDQFHVALHGFAEGVTIVLLIDSCFSGTITRFGNPTPQRPRFIQTEERVYHKRIKPIARTSELGRWIVISGCGEQQTSADAMINGDWRGAFSYYAFATLDRSLTYQKWYEKIRLYLPSKTFDQVPTLEGPEDLLNRIVFI